MTTELSPKKCTQIGCSYESSGICMEGNTQDCQFLEYVDLSIEEKEPEDSNSEIITHVIPSGDDLQDEDLSTITYQFKSNLIVLIGEPDCGKSTLYAALLDRFHKGPLGCFNFAGCLTPVAFEKRAHYARLRSKSKFSTTERTKSFEFSYLHLEVRHQSLTKESQHLVFADINGEKFQRAMDTDDEMSTLGILRYASQIFVMANGSILLDQSSRHALKRNIFLTIERAIQNNVLPKNSKINLIITKWDQIDAAGENEKTHNFLTEPLKSKFPSLIGEVLLIASRSLNPKVLSGTGLDSFLQLCLTPTKQSLITTKILEENSNFREFQRFKYHY